MATPDSTMRRHTHKPNGSAEEAVCPYCRQSISRNLTAIRARIAAEERARLGQLEATLTGRFAREKALAASQAKVAIEKAKREAAKAAEAQIRALRANQDAAISQRLAAQRETLAKQMAEAVNVEKVKAFEEKTQLTQRLAELQRKLEAKPAHELGEPAEVDLFQALEAAFPDDRVLRIAKGQRGPDIVVEVFHHEAAVGSIVIESKNHTRWSSRFVDKLKIDVHETGANFGILSTTTFPKGARQLHIDEGVIVADPARIVVLVKLLRRHLIESHALRLSAEARNERADRLFTYIMSPEASDLFDRLHTAVERLLDVDTHEVTSHQSVWRKRGELIRDVERVHEDFQTALSTICGGETVPQEPAP